MLRTTCKKLLIFQNLAQMSLSPGHFSWMLLPAWAPSPYPLPCNSLTAHMLPPALGPHDSWLRPLCSVHPVVLNARAFPATTLQLPSLLSRGLPLGLFARLLCLRRWKHPRILDLRSKCRTLSSFHSPCSPGQQPPPALAATSSLVTTNPMVYWAGLDQLLRTVIKVSGILRAIYKSHL